MSSSLSSSTCLPPVLNQYRGTRITLRHRASSGHQPGRIKPRPVKARAPQEIAPKGVVERDGPTQADVLLEAIVLVARKPQTAATRGTLRNLIAKFSCECGLGF